MGKERVFGGRQAAAVAAGGAVVGALANRLASRWGRSQAEPDLADATAWGPGAGPDTASAMPAHDVPSSLIAEDYFVESLDWLGVTYRNTSFWTERDIVYVLQRQLSDQLQRRNTDLRVFNGHRVNPGERPAVSADLVIVAPTGEVSLGAEFKYEPCHRRPDIAKGKFPVAVWTDVVKDTLRACQMVDRGTEVAYAICIDEGGWTSKRDRSMFEGHLEWDTECPCGRDHAVDVLIHRVSAEYDART